MLFQFQISSVKSRFCIKFLLLLNFLKVLRYANNFFSPHISISFFFLFEELVSGIKFSPLICIRVSERSIRTDGSSPTSGSSAAKRTSSAT